MNTQEIFIRGITAIFTYYVVELLLNIMDEQTYLYNYAIQYISALFIYIFALVGLYSILCKVLTLKTEPISDI